MEKIFSDEKKNIYSLYFLLTNSWKFLFQVLARSWRLQNDPSLHESFKGGAKIGRQGLDERN